MSTLLKSIAVTIIILGIATSPVGAVDFSGWNSADQAAITSEIQTIIDYLGFDPLDGQTIYLLSPNSDRVSCWSTMVCFGKLNYANNQKMKGLITHEIGHKIFNDHNFIWVDIEYSLGYYEGGNYIHVSGTNPITKKYERTDLGYLEPNQPYCQHCSYMNPGGQSYKEDFADMFMGYFMGYFSNDPAGQIRYQWIENFIKQNFLINDENPVGRGGIFD